MTTIWKEDDITLDKLAAHLANAGLNAAKQDDWRLVLHTESGIGFSLTIDDKRKFIRFGTFLPLDPSASRDAKREFADRLVADWARALALSGSLVD